MHPGHSQRWLALSHYALVVSVSAIVTLWHLGLTSIDGHEAYVASTANNMAHPDYWLNSSVAEGPVPPNTALNHWMIPVFNGEPRLVKTPLAYWCVAGLLKLGLPANEFTARLPSALASIILTIVVLALGRSMFSPRAALFGTLMLSTSLAYVSWGRNARSDMQMTLWMSLAMACVFWAMNQPAIRRRCLLLLVVGGCLGIANLAKQMVPLFLFLPITLYLCWQASFASVEDNAARRMMVRYLIAASIGFLICVLVRVTPSLQWWRVSDLSELAGMIVTTAVTIGGTVSWYAFRSKVWRKAGSVFPMALPGLVLMLALFVPWMMYIGNIFPRAGDIFAAQTTDRALGTSGWMDRSAAPFTAYYVRALAKWSLPWIVFLPGALMMPLKKRFSENRNGLVFLFLWIFGLVLLFSISVGKHEQYIIPAIPAVCLLMGYCAEDVFFKHHWFSANLAKKIVTGYGIAILLTATATAVALAVVEHDHRPLVIHVLIITDITLIPLWLAVALVRSKPAVAFTLMIISVVLAELGYFTIANPWDDRWDNYAILGQRINTEVPADSRIMALEHPDPALVWYGGRDLPMADKIEARMIRVHGKRMGKGLWQQWLAQKPPLWAIASGRKSREVKTMHMTQVGNPIPVDGRQLGLFRRVMVTDGADDLDNNNVRRISGSNQ